MSFGLSLFMKEREEALLSMDRNKMEAFLRKHQLPVPNDDFQFWSDVHIAICNSPQLPREVVDRSRAWVYKHGLGGRILHIRYGIIE